MHTTLEPPELPSVRLPCPRMTCASQCPGTLHARSDPSLLGRLPHNVHCKLRVLAGDSKGAARGWYASTPYTTMRCAPFARHMSLQRQLAGAQVYARTQLFFVESGLLDNMHACARIDTYRACKILRVHPEADSLLAAIPEHAKRVAKQGRTKAPPPPAAPHTKRANPSGVRTPAADRYAHELIILHRQQPE